MGRVPGRSCVILGFLLAAAAPRALCGEPADTEPSPEVYLRLADEVEAQFKEGLLPLWYPRCVDREGGGFYSNFREDWSRGDRQQKTIVYQARMTWLASQVSLGYPDLADEYRRYAGHGLDFLAGTMWDDENGGFYDRGFAFHPAYGLEKVWWTQAEGLNALLLSHERFSGGSSRYFHAFLKQWQFIVEHQIDGQYGGWHGSVARDGTAEPGKDKATIWKAAYHDGRALMEVSERLRRLARPGQPDRR